jgi:hypothetical protein
MTRDWIFDDAAILALHMLHGGVMAYYYGVILLNFGSDLVT